MSEQLLRGKVRDALKPGLVQQVENMIGKGTPDTYASVKGWHGWLELKYADKLPARDSTAVFKSLNRGLEVEQEAWAFKSWQYAPGSAWILAQIGNGYYLVPGKASYSVNEMTLSQFEVYRIASLEDLRLALIVRED